MKSDQAATTPSKRIVMEKKTTTTTTKSSSTRYGSLPGRYHNLSGEDVLNLNNGNTNGNTTNNSTSLVVDVGTGSYYEVNGNANLNTRPTVQRSTLPRMAGVGDGGNPGDKFEIPLPFGFHMDLDFLRICNDEGVSSETLQRLKELRRARRRQRKELEALMGFQREQRNRINQHMHNMSKKPLSPSEEAAKMKSTTLTFQHSPNPASPPLAVDLTHHHTSEFIKEALKDAVLDFEQHLEGTASIHVKDGGGQPHQHVASSKFNTFPRSTGSGTEEEQSAALQSELRERIERLYHQSNSSISSISTTSSALPYNTALSPADVVLAGLPSSVPARSSTDQMETDSITSINSDMSTSTLKNIREQMARSLMKLKEYEKQVEAIPVLQVKLSVLKEEKRLLMLKLKQREFQMRREARGAGEDSDGGAWNENDLMDDTEDDEELEYIKMKMKQPHKFYIEQSSSSRPRARSESPFAKFGKVNPDEFISVRRKRSTSCGYNSDGSDFDMMPGGPGGNRTRPSFYESTRISRSNVRSNLSASQERSELSFFTSGGSGNKSADTTTAPRSQSVPTKDASMNTDRMPSPVREPSPPKIRPISRRERGVNTDAKRTASHGTSTVKVMAFPKGTATSLSMSELVTKDEMEAKVQEAIFRTEEEIMGCPLLQKAMAKVEEEAINGAPVEVTEVKKEVPKVDVQCQVGDENLRPFVIAVGLQCKLDNEPSVCVNCQIKEQELQEAITTKERFLAAVGSTPAPVPVRSIGVGECKIIEEPQDPTAFRHIGVCTEKWVEVIKASKQTDTEDFAYKDTESPRVADMVFEPSPERVVLQRRSSLRKSTTTSPSPSRRSSVNSPLTARKAPTSSSNTQTKPTPTKCQGTMTDRDVRLVVPTRDAKTGGPVVATRTASTSAMSLPLTNKSLPAQGSPLTTPETERPPVRLNLCDKCNNDIQKVAEGIVAGPSPSPKFHAPPSPDLPWLSKIPRPVQQPENPTVHKLKAATSTGNLLSGLGGSRPKSPATSSMQRSKSNLTPTLGRKVLSPNYNRSGSPSTSAASGRRDLGTPPPHPSTPPVGSKRAPSPLARSQSPYSSSDGRKSLIPKLSSGTGGSGSSASGGAPRRNTTAAGAGTSGASSSGPMSPSSAETRSLIPRVATPPALRKMYPKDGADKLATPDRNVVRKNTYTRSSAGVSNPDLEKSSSSSAAAAASKKAKSRMSDIKESDGEDDKKKEEAEVKKQESTTDEDPGNKTDEDRPGKPDFPLPGAALFTPIDESRKKAAPSKEMKAALKVLNDSLLRKSSNPMLSTNAVNIVQQEWFKISSTKGSNPLDVEDYLDAIELDMSKELLERTVNLTDVNGNTALHYSVSHGNFDVVSVLLDSKVANPNILNKAGYTCIMLVSLAQIANTTHRSVVRRLFSLGDVNVRGSQHGQTAIMLAVSHGRLDMAQLLVEAGADVNIRDEDGSTALMCAAEHGHMEIVKYLLQQPDTDVLAKDNDGLTALAVAMEAGHRDVGVILYASMSLSRGASPYSSLRIRSAGGSRTSTPTGSVKSKGATPPRSPIAPTPPHRSRRTSSNQ